MTAADWTIGILGAAALVFVISAVELALLHFGLGGLGEWPTEGERVEKEEGDEING
ncbi:MAG: hypothetical protein KGL39_49730 [Patescibacteria group bacterium]|nr:hypothetical protein [Patescibacteria group bacterium]